MPYLTINASLGTSRIIQLLRERYNTLFCRDNTTPSPAPTTSKIQSHIMYGVYFINEPPSQSKIDNTPQRESKPRFIYDGVHFDDEYKNNTYPPSG